MKRTIPTISVNAAGALATLLFGGDNATAARKGHFNKFVIEPAYDREGVLYLQRTSVLDPENARSEGPWAQMAEFDAIEVIDGVPKLRRDWFVSHEVDVPADSYPAALVELIEQRQQMQAQTWGRNMYVELRQAPTSTGWGLFLVIKLDGKPDIVERFRPNTTDLNAKWQKRVDPAASATQQQ